MSSKQASFPDGDEFFTAINSIEQDCIVETKARIGKLGERAPITNRQLGNILSMLYRESTCFYGCQGGDHFAQRFAGRVVTHSLASYRMLCAGYYDESFALTRNIGEMSNLLFLFAFRPEIADEWKTLDEPTRRTRFKPVDVRKRLEALSVPVPIDKDRYAGLCEVGVHVGPDVSPQHYMEGGRPTLGAVFQEWAFVAGLNELSASTAICAAGLYKALDTGERGVKLKAESVELLNNIGGVDLAMVRRV